MEYVQPIRNIADIEAMKNGLAKNGQRDLLLFLCGIYLGRRVGDLLKLKVSDLKGQTVLKIKEEKTGKIISLGINAELQKAVAGYVQNMSDDAYLFESRKGNQPITRGQAYKILNNCATKCNISEIGTHSMRKTFGYHYYQKTHDIAMLQKLFGHSSPAITLRYIGIDDDMTVEAMQNFSYDKA